MEKTTMAEMRVAGTYITNSRSTETFKAYVPNPLPPDPPLNLNAEHFALLDNATLALGRLDGLIGQLPDNLVILYTYFCVRKEAVLSSQIEGTQSTLSDLLLYENNEAIGVPEQDVVEVSSYVVALEQGLKRIQEGFPLCLRLIREMHEIL